MATAELLKSMRAKFAPVLRRDGFAGSGSRYFRTVRGQIQIVEVQGSRQGGRFAINMGVHPQEIPLWSGVAAEPKRLREMDCAFRRRLASSGADQWWDYGESTASMDQAATEACRVYENIGRHQLDALYRPGSALESITPAHFASGTYQFEGFKNTYVRTAWALALMRGVWKPYRCASIRCAGA